MKKLDPKSDKLTSINYSSTLKINHANEREAMFDDMVNEERERFYRTDMHGVDWTALSEHYRGFLPYINNNYDYAELLSELLGELNVSHTGCRYRPQNSANSERTASLGLLFNLNYTGKGLKIDEVVENGPFDKSSSKVKAGCIIEKINGVAIDNQDNDYTILLNDISGKKTLVSVYDPAGGSRFDEVVVPITASAMSDLLYNRWVKQRAADVDKWSNGRLGYVHIQSMGDPSFRTMYADVLGKYNDREGIVIDIRWNGGGRLHEDVEILFSGKKYFTQVIRGIESCDMPSRRWNKPSIMVQNEACYSNAHGTPWVYKHQGLGKLVGMPVAGTMTSVNWVTMQDRSLVYGIPVVGYRLPDGSYLENTQLEPDIKVVNTPESIVLGQDLQLKAAVDELLKELSNK
jgi:tricorn protease